MNSSCWVFCLWCFVRLLVLWEDALVAPFVYNIHIIYNMAKVCGRLTITPICTSRVISQNLFESLPRRVEVIISARGNKSGMRFLKSTYGCHGQVSTNFRLYSVSSSGSTQNALCSFCSDVYFFSFSFSLHVGGFKMECYSADYPKGMLRQGNEV